MIRNASDERGTRVLLVAPQPLYEDRGTPIALLHVLKALSELGCTVDVLTYPVGIDVAIPGVRWLRVQNPLQFKRIPVGLSYRKVVLDVLIAAHMEGLLRTNHYDYIHAVEEAAFIAAAFSRRMGVPLLYDMQSSIPQQLSRHRLFGLPLGQAALQRCESWLLKRAALVVASAGLGGYVKEREPSVHVEEWLYPAAVWSGRAAEAGLIRRLLGVPAEAKIAVYSGTFEEYQGLPALVDAARRVVEARPATVFIAVGGDGRSTDRLRSHVDRLGLMPHFHVIERQARDRAGLYIELADVLISPRAHGNNLPLKIGDYMAASKPIVATRIPAHTVVLDSTRAVLTETDGESLARGILTVLDDAAEAARMAAAAKAYGDEHLSWRAFVSSVRGHVRQLTGDCARPSSNGAAPQLAGVVGTP